MISFFLWIIQVSESDLGHGENRLVCQQTAVFFPATVNATVVTITLFAIRTRICCSTCAHLIRACCSSPVLHLCSITWHPPSVIVLDKTYVIVALKLDKLFTVLWDSSECCQLNGADSSVSHIFSVTSPIITSRNIPNMSSFLTVMTDDRHTNSTFVTHVTVHIEGCHASFAIGVNHIGTWGCSSSMSFYFTTRGWFSKFKNSSCSNRAMKVSCDASVGSSIVANNIF